LVFVLVLVLVVLSIRMPKSCRVLVALVTIATAADFEAPHGVSLFPAFSVLDSNVSTPSGLVARLGRGTKSPSNPLFGQTLPWEPRIDNGYANVVYDKEYSSERPWRLWYDAFTSCNDDERDQQYRYLHCGGGKRHHGGLYAESADGLTWEKPRLDSGVTYLEGTGFCCDSKVCECKAGTPGAVKTNIYAMQANGNTVYLDRRPNVPAAEKYLVVGNNLPANFEPAAKPLPDFGSAGGICASPDGLNYTYANCQWLEINNSHWDSWSTMFWDEASDSYLASMRSHDTYNPCGDRFYPSCQGSKAPCDMAACVHSTRDVSRIQSLGSEWRTLGSAYGGSVPMLRARDGGAQLYEIVTFPYYGVYLGLLDVYYAAGARQEVHCELAWSSDYRTWHRIDEGHDLVPLGPEGSFESHICYGSVPLPSQDDSNSILEYYFGGDGPHYGTRNSSLALISFREHGLAGVGAPRHWHAPVAGRTKALTVTGSQLLVTADTDTLLAGGENPEGSKTLCNVGKLSISVHLEGVSESEPLVCSPLVGLNVTNTAMKGCDLTSVVGKQAILEISIDGSALLYMIGFST